jgi:hypothetical protein
LDFKLTEPFGHELLIAMPNKCSQRFNRGPIEMAASYESSVQPRRDGWSFRRDEWQGVGPGGAANAMNGWTRRPVGPMLSDASMRILGIPDQGKPAALKGGVAQCW